MVHQFRTLFAVKTDGVFCTGCEFAEKRIDRHRCTFPGDVRCINHSIIWMTPQNAITYRLTGEAETV